jgi:hypothetical protein
LSTLGLRFFGHLAVEGIQKRQKIVAFLCTLSSRDSPGSSCEKLRAARDLPQGSLWNMALDDGHIRQAQFYVFSENKRGDKIRYMHRNPVKGDSCCSRHNGPAAIGTTPSETRSSAGE